VTERTARDTVPPVARPTVPTPRSELQRYVGEYRTPRGDVTGVRVMLEDSVLVVTLPSGDRYTARPLGGGLFELQREGADVWHSLFRVSGDDILLSERDVVTGAQVGGEEIERYEAMQYSAQQLQEYVGAYEGERVEGTLHVTVDGDRLMIAARGLAPIELAPAKDADTFRVPDYLVRFSRDAGGRVSHVTFDARRVQGMRYARQRAPAN
jgi:hypothetical protein